MAKAKIMIVEDDRIVADDIQESLKKLGYAVSAIVSFGEEAIQKAKEDKPDLVLMDIVLSGEMNGTEAADLIRSQFKIPVVYLTAYADENLLERAKVTEPYGYIIKPFEDRELKIAIEIALYKNRMDKKLQESEEWFSTTLKSIGDAVITSDAKGCVTFMNPVAEKLTGWSQDEAIGKPINQVFLIINEKTRESCDNPVEKVMATGVLQGLANDTILISKDGKEYIISDSGAPIFDSDNTIIGVVLIFHDVTEKIILQKQIIQSQKMESIGTMSGGIAHDFNNILGIILGNAELALDDIPEWNPAHFNLEEIKTASLRAKNVVRQLLSFIRKTDIKRQPINIIPIIKDSIKFLRSTISANIDIRQNIQDTADAILADSTQIHQIMMNLCTNASQAMPDGGILNIGIQNVVLDEDSASLLDPELTPGNYVKMTFSDTGHGIAPEIIERIFDPYFTTRELGDGSGLGLSVVHGIIKIHNGAITVDSKLGKGTTFSVFFPVTKEKVVTGSKIVEEFPSGNERILFVDDEASIVKLGHQMLVRFGYKVESTTSPIEALDLFRSEPDQFDLVITDQTMPKMNGDQLIKEIQNIRSDIPIILCTGFSKKIDGERAREIGATGYLEKPHDKHDLAKMVRKVLDGKNA